MSVVLLVAASMNMQCIAEHLAHAEPSLTVAELQQHCHQTEAVVIEAPLEQSQEISQRLLDEQQIHTNKFGLSALYNNYILFASYNQNAQMNRWEYSDSQPDPWEMKFQFSFKVPLLPAHDNGGMLYMGYTNQSWWQAFNDDASAPFRDTNHMPEILWIQPFHGLYLGDWQLQAGSLSLNHQSNGRSGLASRSWNRIIGSLAFEHNRWVLGARAWYRLPEQTKLNPEDSKGDDNPDITDYLGYGELFGLYARDQHNFNIRLRGNPQAHHSAVELGWSFPIKGKIRGYLQGYWGYGENLLDYNQKSERISIGIEVTPLL